MMIQIPAREKLEHLIYSLLAMAKITKLDKKFHPQASQGLFKIFLNPSKHRHFPISEINLTLIMTMMTFRSDNDE